MMILIGQSDTSVVLLVAGAKIESTQWRFQEQRSLKSEFLSVSKKLAKEMSRFQKKSAKIAVGVPISNCQKMTISFAEVARKCNKVFKFTSPITVLFINWDLGSRMIIGKTSGSV